MAQKALRRILRKIHPTLGFLALGVMFWMGSRLWRDHPDLSTILRDSLGLWCLGLPFVMLFKFLSWQAITAAMGVGLPWQRALTAYGLSIAGRYLPGKVLFVVGRMQAYGEGQKTKAGLAMVVELTVELCAAFVLVMPAALLGWVPERWSLPLLMAMLVTLLLIVVPTPGKGPWRLLERWTGTWQPMSRTALWGLPLAMTLIHWACYLACLHLWVGQSLGLTWLDLPLVGASLALAGLIGTLSLITPGGLGVREGMAALLFTQLGLENHQAFALAIAARFVLWGGESCGVLGGWILSILQKDKTSQPPSP